jgi:undecaprenyl-diphosphatase
MNFDYYLFKQLNDLAGHYRWIGYLSIFFARYFQYILIAGALGLFFWGRDNDRKNARRTAVLAFFSAVISRFIITDAIRYFYFRPRPFSVYQVFQLIPHEPTGSLPSGHAAFFFAMAMVIYGYDKKIGYCFFAGAFLISVARIFAGVHYPMDILVGVVVGIITGFFGEIIYKKMTSIENNP